MATNYQVKVDLDLLSSYHNHEFDHLSVQFLPLSKNQENDLCTKSCVQICNSSGTVLTYHCSYKHVTKCKAKCRVSVLDNEEGKRYVLSQFADLSDHNHPTEEGEIIAQEMIFLMEERFRKRLNEKPSVVTKGGC